MSIEFGSISELNWTGLTPISDDGTYTNGHLTPKSSYPDGSLFGSGSSVLSAFEPPTESEYLGAGVNRNILKNILKDEKYDGNQDDIEAVISKLQAMKLFKQQQQGIQMSSPSVDEKMLMGYINNNRNINSFSSQDFNNANHQINFNAYTVNNDNNVMSDGNTTASITTYPPSQPSIWNMDSDLDTSLELAKAAQAVEAAAAAKTPSIANIPNLIPPYLMPFTPQELAILDRYHQEEVQGYKAMKIANRQKKLMVKKNRRINGLSVPVALRPPQWAEPNWNPLLPIYSTKGDKPISGTGVFIPLHLRNNYKDDDTCTAHHISNEKNNENSSNSNVKEEVDLLLPENLLQ